MGATIIISKLTIPYVLSKIHIVSFSIPNSTKVVLKSGSISDVAAHGQPWAIDGSMSHEQQLLLYVVIALCRLTHHRWLQVCPIHGRHARMHVLCIFRALELSIYLYLT